MSEIQQWTVFETQFESTMEYANPFWDAAVTATFVAPSGAEHTIEAFWDGHQDWRLRFSPDEVGVWHWSTTCSNPADTGLHDQRGSFTCTAYDGDNPLYRHGPLKVSADGRYLTYTDDTPFFWLADTAWNGVLRAKRDDWARYLSARREQGFSVIQYVSTHWRGHTKDAHGETAFSGSENVTLNPAFFGRLDQKIAIINEYGLIAAPIMLWALTEIDPGQVLSEADAIRMARYIMARHGAYQVVWMPGGDGHYDGEHTPHWQRIGRAVFADRKDRLVTMHPCGQSWVGEEFRAEPWFDFIGYQSGHGSSDEHLHWLVQGPPAQNWSIEPVCPVINLEPNYEGHPSYHAPHGFTDYEVRRAAYWSLLVSPTAGVTYGTNPIWVWPEGVEPAENHKNLTHIEPWHTALDTPGVRSMTILRAFFAALPWWQLEPAPDLLAEQPGETAPADFVAAARSRDGQVSVIYTPGAPVDLREAGHAARWFNPRTGGYSEASADGDARYTPPEEGDWLIILDHSA